MQLRIMHCGQRSLGHCVLCMHPSAILIKAQSEHTSALHPALSPRKDQHLAKLQLSQQSSCEA